MYLITDVGLNLPDLQGSGDHPLSTIITILGIAGA